MKRKSKLKVFAVLTSLCLWFYVAIVVDPESNMEIEGLPINISNPVELTENNLLLSSDVKPTIDLFLEGRLSDLRNLKKENIRASIEIQNPSEGKNEANISISVPDNIKYNLKDDSIIVNLEKNIHISKDIDIVLPKNINKDDYLINLSSNKIKISGARSVIKRVDKILANIKEDSFALNKSFGVQLTAVDSRGTEVENVSLENSILEVNIKKIENKEVSIVPIFDKDDVSFKLSKDKVFISGDASIIENIDSINTKVIKVNTKNKENLKVELELPEGVSIKNSTEEIFVSILKDK